MILKREPE